MHPGIILCTSKDSMLLWILLLMCFCLNRQRAFFLPTVGVHGRLWFPSSSYRLIWILSRLSIRQYHPYILTSRTMSLKTFLEKILSPSLLPWTHWLWWSHSGPSPREFCPCFFIWGSFPTPMCDRPDALRLSMTCIYENFQGLLSTPNSGISA